MKILLWYRNDLRIHDHEALFKASEKTSDVIPVYIFDPRIFQEHPLGFAKTGELRHQFLIESVENLRENLQKIGLEFGGRDHSTVSTACDKIKEELETNPNLNNVLKEIKMKLQ